MKYKNTIKFTLVFILTGMCASLIINYYINKLETKNMITTSHDTCSLGKSQYETSILNPQYFFHENENRELIIQAKNANKVNSQINLESVSGNVKLKNNFDFSFDGQKAILMIDKKELIFDGKVNINNKNIVELHSSNLLISYNDYTIYSDKEIILNYDNIVLIASKFAADKNQILKFTEGVKMKINNT